MRQWKVLRWGGPLHLYGCSKTRVKRVGGRWLRNIWQVGNGPKKGERGRKQGRHFDGLAVSQQEGGERIIRAISPLKRPPIFLHTKMTIGRRGHLENVRRTFSLESSGAAHAALKSSLKLGERNPFLSFSLPLFCLILMMTYGENGSRKCAQLPPQPPPFSYVWKLLTFHDSPRSSAPLQASQASSTPQEASQPRAREDFQK